MIRKNFFLTQQQIDRLEALQAEYGTNMSEQIRQAINLYLDVAEGKSEVRRIKAEQQ